MTHRARLCVAFLLGLGTVACGHKSPPIPPPLKNPAPTTDLRIQQRGDELILEFTYPLLTVGGLPLPAIEKVEYWELVKPLAPPVDETDEAESSEAADEEEVEEETAEEVVPPAVEEDLPRGAAPATPLPPPPTKEQMAAVELLEFAATAEVRLTLESEELSAATIGEKIVLRLPFTRPATEETVYIYSVKTFSDERQVSNWSNLATLVRREPPPTPEGFEVEAQAGGVRVAWKNARAEARREALAKAAKAGETAPLPEPLTDEERQDAGLTKAFRVYRRDAQARNYGVYLGQIPADADEYLDRTAQYGNRYIYALTAVGLYSPLVESALAGEIEIDYQDRFAPPAPQNPVALAEAGRVRVLWDESPAPDLKGYVVFRRQPGSTDFLRLNTKPILDLEYDDRDVAPGTEYEYRVAAVDRVGNQGDPSVTVSVRTP